MEKKLFLAMCLLVFLPLNLIAADPPQNQITVYQDKAYSGSSSNMSRDQANLVQSGWNDMITSIKLGPGVLKVILYENINYGGSSKTIKSNTDLAGTSWNDKVSSFKIILMPEAPQSGTVRFYLDGEYSGNSFEASGTEENANLVSSGWNDKISSIMVGSGCEVKIFADTNFGGNNTIIKTNTDFSGNWWNDKISSFRVVPK
jgi:hypothetical protein